MSDLTPKQEKFVQALIAGKSQREAYKQAYNAANMKDETIDKRASELFSKGAVKGRYQELLEELRKKALYTREEAVYDLLWIKEEAKKDIQNPKKGLRQANGTIYLNAVKELSTLNALYPDKNEEKLDDDMIIKIVKASEQDE